MEQQTVVTSGVIIGLLLTILGYLLKRKDKSNSDDIKNLKDNVNDVEDKFNDQMKEDKEEMRGEIRGIKAQQKVNDQKITGIERNYIDRFNEVNKNILIIQSKVDNIVPDIKKEIKIMLLENYTKRTDCITHTKDLENIIDSKVKTAIIKEMTR